MSVLLNGKHLLFSTPSGLTVLDVIKPFNHNKLLQTFAFLISKMKRQSYIKYSIVAE